MTTAAKKSEGRAGWGTRRDAVLFAAFVFLWLCPLLYRGLSDQAPFPFLGSRANYIYSAACLFTHRERNWNVFHLEGTVDGEQWFALGDEQYSPMQPFGYINRLNRIIQGLQLIKSMPAQVKFEAGRLDEVEAALAAIPAEPQWQARRDELASELTHWRGKVNELHARGDRMKVGADELLTWVQQRHRLLHPEEPALVGTRILWVGYPVGSEALMNPTGPWVNESLDSVPAERRWVLWKKIFVSEVSR